MDQRSRILDAVAELTTARGRLPSILEVAAEVGLTKQGVLHYFPSRAALDSAVIMRSVERIDRAMRVAADGAPETSPTATYLRLSSPDDADCATAAVVLAAGSPTSGGMPAEVGEAVRRWEALIGLEVGDPVRAEVVRLTGDGLFAEALASGVPPDAERVERLVAHLLAPMTPAHR
ncbi:TetR/AcrR family transcriptional regulator [Nocardioides euryhalodurans]|uniref:TetR/AcrR family transcriptional regulator n=1 Tax=Nocardioides euryhalodurans TaxID=2518370 RepID=A0A4P7GPE0_9ACTN|nr:TetR/AcrR family transcriptional regulator [Nocardioides euryhalodurans]QBR93834.1 TetR/AcrR family transcriptional regulator [Nocardioides euryhalodurans]